MTAPNDIPGYELDPMASIPGDWPLIDEAVAGVTVAEPGVTELLVLNAGTGGNVDKLSLGAEGGLKLFGNFNV